MARVLTFAQQKGGAGKTTLLTQIAAALIARGHGVGLVDLDPQRSLAGWVDARAKARGGALDLAFWESSEWRASGDIRRASAECVYVLVDCPGAADVLLRSAMRAAELVIVPAQPSPPDAWAARATLKAALREGVPARVALNRVSPRGGPVAAVEEMLRADGADFFDARIGNRVAFAAAFLEGRGVVEPPRSAKAAAEIDALTEETLAVLG